MSATEAFLDAWKKHSRVFGDFRVLKTETHLHVLKDETFFTINFDPIVDRSTQPQLIEFFQNHLEIYLEQQRVIAAGGATRLSEGVL